MEANHIPLPEMSGMPASNKKEADGNCRADAAAGAGREAPAVDQKSLSATRQVDDPTGGRQADGRLDTRPGR